MIIAKSHDTRLTYKSQLIFYLPSMNNWNVKLKKKEPKKRKKEIGINLTKHMEGLYEGNYKTMMKEIRSK